MNSPENTKISIHFHPYEFDKSNHAVEKEDGNGVKRRYLVGVSSGPKTDGHAERMTSNCIKSFMDQSNAGDVLLYSDVHGIKASEDIGKLSSAKVLDDGDWYTEYRLYDEQDEVGPNKLEKIDTLWKQQVGLPPYTHPRQKGFSVEGNITPNGIISGEPDGMGSIRKRVIDNILLEGVILVPRPAYKDSVSTAVFKALGELPPEFRNNLKKSMKNELRQRLEVSELDDAYYKEKWNINDTMDSQIERIMNRDKDNRKREQLEILFDEYKELMIDLLVKSENLFIKEENSGEESNDPYGVGRIEVEKDSKIESFRKILKNLKTIEKNLN